MFDFSYPPGMDELMTVASWLHVIWCLVRHLGKDRNEGCPGGLWTTSLQQINFFGHMVTSCELCMSFGFSWPHNLQ